MEDTIITSALYPQGIASLATFYEFEHAVTYSDSAFYRLKIVDNNRRWMYTNPVLYHVNNTTAFMIYPSVVTSHVLNVFLKDPFKFLEVVTTSGEIKSEREDGTNKCSSFIKSKPRHIRCEIDGLQ
jgi:hypothetical protein